MLNASISLYPFDPLGPPGRGLERVREVLRLAGNLTIAELHDANRVNRAPVVADHVLANPQVAASHHSANGKAQFRRVVSAQSLYVIPAADPLSRLGVLDHDIIMIDLVFSIQVPRRRGRSVLVQGSSNCLILHRLSPLLLLRLYEANL
jgi:hypothetical protein